MTKYYCFGAFLVLILSLLPTPKTYSHPTGAKASKAMVVVIDPGHGGKDPGAVNKGGIREKDAVLGIGLKLGKLISENFPDVKIIYTRSTDVFVPLIDRSRIANKNKADLFISIHANFCGTSAIRGTETYFLGLPRSNENLDVAKKENSVILLEDNYSTTYQGFDPNSSESYIMFETVQDVYMEQSLSFADDVQQQFRSKLEGSNRGVKQAGFLVLRMSAMPSVLIETGFISNPAEANYLMSDQGEQNIAHSILEAFRKFKSKSSRTKNQVLASTENHAKSKQSTALGTDSVQKNEKATPAPDNLASEKATVNAGANTAEPVNKEDQSLNQEVKEEIKKPVSSSENNANPDVDPYFSVQIAASLTSVEPLASNFKGMKNVRREKSDKYYRYYVGKEASVAQITPLLDQVKHKFPQAFIVSFVAGKRIVVNNTK